MDLEGYENRRQLSLIIGVTHAAVSMYMLWMFNKAKTESEYLTSAVDEDGSRLQAAYVVMASLSLAEAISAIVLILAIVMTKAVYMLPWLIVTTITVITGLVYDVAVFPNGRIMMWVLILSALALFPVFSLYRKYKTVSMLAPPYNRAENYPLNLPQTTATAPPPPPPETYTTPSSNNTASETLDGEPPSYDAVMGIAPPYPVADSAAWRLHS